MIDLRLVVLGLPWSLSDMSSGELMEELLTGFLDGNLSEEEARQVQAALLNDAALRGKLQQLRDLGNQLKRVPQRKLGQNFAQRVIAEAQRQAVQSGLPEDHHVRLAEQAEILAFDKATPPAWRLSLRLAGIVASLAAAVLIAVGVVRWSGTGNVQPSDDAMRVAAAQPNQINGSGDSPILELSPLEAAIVNNQNAAPGGDQLNEPSASFVGSDLERQRRMQGDRALFQLLTVLDVQPTKAAWDNNVVYSVLQQVGISIAQPIVASPALLKTLKETRATVQDDNGQDSRVALIFVGASAKQLDKAMTELWHQQNDFPIVSMDLAFDRPSQELIEQLDAATGAISAARETFAVPLVVNSTAAGGLANTAQFSNASKQGSPVDRKEKPTLLSDEETFSFLLIVVREPS